MIQDIHSHSYYSFCGKDNPEDLIKTAIESGIEVFGICDHNYGIGVQRAETVFNNDWARVFDYNRSLTAYYNHLDALSDKYKDKIIIKKGVEVATANQDLLVLPDGVDLSLFDYCIIEHIDFENTVVTDLFEYAKSLNCKKVGIAHTDLKKYISDRNLDALEFFTKMADMGMFWEMNVSYDSIHNYREHQYVKDFFNDKALQDTVRQSGVEISVGFDGHRLEDYAPERVISACEKLKELNIPMPFYKECLK